jgi:hypothetical protein
MIDVAGGVSAPRPHHFGHDLGALAVDHDVAAQVEIESKVGSILS